MTVSMIQSGSLNFAVETWGQGPLPLILLHGLASTRHMFGLVAPLLTDDFTVIAPDQRGHGESSKPEDGYEFDTVCADLDALLDAMGISRPFRLGGHSWGAYTALHYAATRPDAVEKLFLIDGGIVPIGARFDGWEDAEQKMAPPPYVQRRQAAIEHMIRADWLGDAFRPDLLPLALSIFDLSDPADVRARLPRDQHMLIAHELWAYDPLPDLARLDCPADALIAVKTRDQADPLVVESANRAQAAYPPLRLIWMEDTIHDAPWQRPVELAALLRT